MQHLGRCSGDEDANHCVGLNGEKLRIVNRKGSVKSLVLKRLMFDVPMIYSAV